MRQEQAEVDRELERFCAQARGLRARAVILFGSRAQARHTEASDADVCLIAPDLHDDLFRRRYPSPSGYRFLSVFGFHPQEFLDLLAQANPFVLDIVYEGKALYDDGFLDDARAVYEAALRRHGLRRTPKGWEWSPSAPHS